jgi:hypothetical protein
LNFQEAISYTLELKRQQLQEEGTSATDQDLHVAVLADLQQLQDKESSETIDSAVDMVILLSSSAA